MNNSLNIVKQHWVIGGITASLLWFLAGVQTRENKKPSYALCWQGMALLLIVVLCGYAVYERAWLGALAGGVVLIGEVLIMKRNYERSTSP